MSSNGDGPLTSCRVGCGACCVELSISSPIPGMPNGKRAGERCVQLTEDNTCMLFGHPKRPRVCVSLKPSHEMCGDDDTHAFSYLRTLEELTKPSRE